MKRSTTNLLVALATLSLTFSACKSSRKDEPIPPSPPQPEKPKEYLKPAPIKTITIQDEDEDLVTTASYSKAGDLTKVVVELIQPGGGRQLAQEYLYERASRGNRVTRYTSYGLRGTKAEIIAFHYENPYGSMPPHTAPFLRYYNGIEKQITYDPLGTISNAIYYLREGRGEMVISKQIIDYTNNRREYVRIRNKGGNTPQIFEKSTSSYWGNKRPELETTIDVDQQGREIKRTFIDYEGGGSVDGATYWTSLTTVTEYKYDDSSPYLSQLGCSYKKETTSKATKSGMQIYTESYRNTEMNEYGLISKRWRDVSYMDTSNSTNSSNSYPQTITYEYYSSKK